jgi:hypothetical protein
MSGMNELNRRRFVRVTLDLPLACVIGSADPVPAVTRDVGRGGFCVDTVRPLEIGAPVLLRFALAVTGGAPLELKGRVAWREEADRQFRLGLRACHDEPDVAVTLGDLMLLGLRQQGVVPPPASSLRASPGLSAA